MEDMKEGEELSFDYVPARAPAVTVKGKAKGTIAGKILRRRPLRLLDRSEARARRGLQEGAAGRLRVHTGKKKEGHKAPRWEG